jgi:hypothetical protein
MAERNPANRLGPSLNPLLPIAANTLAASIGARSYPVIWPNLTLEELAEVVTSLLSFSSPVLRMDGRDFG